jgi:hypothetical protein
LRLCAQDWGALVPQDASLPSPDSLGFIP